MNNSQDPLDAIFLNTQKEKDLFIELQELKSRYNSTEKDRIRLIEQVESLNKERFLIRNINGIIFSLEQRISKLESSQKELKSKESK